ncbi:MBL fold metallo-hydrolase [Pyrococcus sp. ST04]|uniref:MBL fold metallo-hydrolase n=1 Tax=Pyrococcus sp. ST04 TaxID=1183377 RepID=UPI0002605C21|nr:MBL fold metallo-hydrolase [Pyrococcus sp. ST04]AFK22341.1 putative mRNA 3'-end processing factor [Pyrococcus sp. ST04]
MLIGSIALDWKGNVAFQSHAHTDHFASAKIIFSTKETAYFSHLRNSKFYKIVKLGKRFYIGDYKAKLYPSGHILGASGIKIWLDEGTLYYTGDIKLEKLRTAKKAKVPRADFLIIEATFGVPMYSFPSPKHVEKIIIGEVEKSLDRGETPVFMANPYGKAQEVISILNAHGYAPKVDNAIKKVSRIYSKFGVKLKIDEESNVIVSSSRGIKVSGFGSIKLSNHADFWELVEIVERVNPETVFTIFGYSRAFAKLLRGLGYEAFPIKKGEDLRKSGLLSI